MEDLKNTNTPAFNNKDIIFSKTIKAGKRIYYLDVKMNRKEELFLAITESKKVIVGKGDDTKVKFEKHKIFLYKEDFDKFRNGLDEALQFIEEKQGKHQPQYLDDSKLDSIKTSDTPLVENVLGDSEIKIDIDFED